jgi:hypothetical protein
MRIPSPREFAIVLKRDIDALKGTCPLCVHDHRNQSSREQEITKKGFSIGMDSVISVDNRDSVGTDSSVTTERAGSSMGTDSTIVDDSTSPITSSEIAAEIHGSEIRDSPVKLESFGVSIGLVTVISDASNQSHWESFFLHN